MVNGLKKCLILLLILSIVWVPTKVYAQEQEPDDFSDLYDQVIDIIKSNYLETDELSEKELFEAAMKGMFALLDPYSEFMTIEENQNFVNAINQSYVGIGVSIHHNGGINSIQEVFNDSPAQKAGLRQGDIFKKVGTVDVIGLSTDQLVNLIVGEAGTEVTITLQRDLKEYSVTMVRAPIHLKAVKRVALEEDSSIAYVKISSFSSEVDTEFQAVYDDLVAEGVKYLILDLRDNGGGYVQTAVNLAKLIVPKGNIVEFEDADGISVAYTSDTEKVPFKIYALINENSISSTEFVCGAIQDSGSGVLIGETTYGKGVAQTLIPLNEDYEIKLTFAEFFTRDHHKVKGIGVKPDYPVYIPSLLAITDKYYPNDVKDEVLQVEEILTYLGYNVGTPDTTYDGKTTKAIKDFQRNFGGYSYGVCDFGTQKALNQALYDSIMEHDIQLEKALSLIHGEIGQK